MDTVHYRIAAAFSHHLAPVIEMERVIHVLVILGANYAACSLEAIPHMLH